MTFKSHSSYGVHIVNHLAADGACLTCGKIAVVALVEGYAYFVSCLVLKLLESLLCILVSHFEILLMLIALTSFLGVQSLANNRLGAYQLRYACECGSISIEPACRTEHKFDHSPFFAPATCVLC